MERTIIGLLLLVALSLGSPTLIISTTASYSGTSSTSYQYAYFVVNNSSRPLIFQGYIIPPYSAKMVYVAANGSYPPPLLIMYTVSYVNATLSGQQLVSRNGSLVEVNITIKNFMPFAVPVTVLVQRASGVDIFSSRPPSGVQSLGGSAVYQWTFVVGYSYNFTLTYRIESFGSFGAVSLPPVEIISDVDLDGYLSQTNYTINYLNKTYNYLYNLSYATNLISSAVYNLTNNLDELRRILNLSSVAFREGAVGLNASRYAIAAVNSQLMSLSSSLLAAAIALNRSLLLVQYEYAYLTTLSSALEAQAIAISAYEKSVGATVNSLNGIENNLYTIYYSLNNIEQSLYKSKENLINIKNKLSKIRSNNTYIENATSALIDQLNSAISTVDSLISAVNSAEQSVAAMIAIVSNTRDALVAVGAQLSQVQGILNQTAASTRGNATALEQEMPPVILNISRSLVSASRNLTDVAGQVSALERPLGSGVQYLQTASQELAAASYQIDALSKSLKGELFYLGLANSLVENYLYNITNNINRDYYYISIVKTYRKIYNAGRVEYQFVLQLPIAVRLWNITLPTNLGVEKPSGSDLSAYIYLPILASAVAVGLYLGVGKGFIKRRLD